MSSYSRYERGDPGSESDWIVEPMKEGLGFDFDASGMHVLGGVFFKVTSFVDSIPEVYRAVDELEFYLRHAGVYFEHETGEEFELDEPVEPSVFYKRSLSFANEALVGLDAVMERGRGFL